MNAEGVEGDGGAGVASPRGDLKRRDRESDDDGDRRGADPANQESPEASTGEDQPMQGYFLYRGANAPCSSDKDGGAKPPNRQGEIVPDGGHQVEETHADER